MFQFCDGYKAFLDKAKTEREYVKEAVLLAEKSGYENLDKIIAEELPLTTGDKIYRVVKNKAIVFAIIGKNQWKTGQECLGRILTRRGWI